MGEFIRPLPINIPLHMQLIPAHYKVDCQMVDEDNLPCLSWHENQLKSAEAKFLAGNIEIMDWQHAKKDLRSQFEGPH